jgi:hypothetical protein
LFHTQCCGYTDAGGGPACCPSSTGGQGTCVASEEACDSCAADSCAADGARCCLALPCPAALPDLLLPCCDDSLGPFCCPQNTSKANSCVASEAACSEAASEVRESTKRRVRESTKRDKDSKERGDNDDFHG